MTEKHLAWRSNIPDVWWNSSDARYLM